VQPTAVAICSSSATENVLKIKPERKCKVYVLHALEVERDEYGQSHILITDTNFLLSLLNILIRQEVKQYGQLPNPKFPNNTP